MNSLIPYKAPKKSLISRVKDKGYQAIFGLFLLLLVSSGFFTRKERIVEVEVCTTDTIYQEVKKSKKATLITGKVGKGSVTPPTIPTVVSAEKYIQQYQKPAIKSFQESGVLASITLAQGLLESNAGNSGGAKVANNHFGMKCFSKRHKWCCVKACDDSNSDSFKRFNSASECYTAHGLFLKNSTRYRKLFTYGKDYKKWAHGLQTAGYATDKKYAQKLIGVIERYQLYKYD